MPDILMSAWLWFDGLLNQPAIAAALAAMAFSGLKMLVGEGLLQGKKWIESAMAGGLAYLSIPVVVSLGFDPNAGAFFGAVLGYLGISTLEEKLDQVLDAAASIIGRRK
ncbi:MAG TPA: phage holin family protein [Modicisalibacter sp.]|nr:phage holin family protein [Modicisalibacter sp.]